MTASKSAGLVVLTTCLLFSNGVVAQQQQQDPADATAAEGEPVELTPGGSDSAAISEPQAPDEGQGGEPSEEPERSEEPEYSEDASAPPTDEPETEEDLVEEFSPSGDGAVEETEYSTDPAPFAPTLRPEEDYQMPPKPPYMGPFRKGLFNVGLSIGYQSSATQAWFVPGVSLGYFLVNGLQVHLDTDFWIGDPFVATPAPGVRFVFFMLPVVNPYVGAFYRHYFVASGFDDDDSVGGRAGVNILTGQRSYFGGGVVYERMLRGSIFASQNLVYPEIQFAFSF